MRKIPNVNKHIFKQPNIPWSEAGFSADAQAVINRMTAPSSLEQSSIATFVDTLVADGNYALLDEIFGLSLGSTNGLIGFKGLATATNQGATFDINGASFVAASTQYIDTGFNMATDSVKYTLDDALITEYTKVMNPTGGQLRPFGVSNAGFTAQASMTDRTGSNGSTYINGANVSHGTGVMTSDQTRAIVRESNLIHKVYNDGVKVIDGSKASVEIPNGNMFLGAYNIIGTGASGYYTGTISLFAIGAAVGFNHVAWNTAVRTFLTNLGLTL